MYFSTRIKNYDDTVELFLGKKGKYNLQIEGSDVTLYRDDFTRLFEGSVKEFVKKLSAEPEEGQAGSVEAKPSEAKHDEGKTATAF
jgi:hypothetical protein